MLYLISLNLIKYLFCSHHFWTFVQCRQFQLSPNPTPGQGWWWSTGAADSARYWSIGRIDESWECLSLTTVMSLSFEKFNVFSLVLERDRMSEVLCWWFTFLLFGDMSLNDIYEINLNKNMQNFYTCFFPDGESHNAWQIPRMLAWRTGESANQHHFGRFTPW